ncbi:hypothetical protein O181_121200 [Austropuccinia psidii MF-1]|uniref:Uncharacterized protein n=1 Tax=Austropuccinia psidii MF-1 TaxID=1389203 RepID=A0A9Q3KLS4_9BASI|nr:hypothetical protein [Austropuccinia psidii MF-1]
MDFCTCTSCRKNSITCANGKTRHGLFVDPSTRRRHWRNNPSKQAELDFNNVSPPISLHPNEDLTTQSSIDHEESNENSHETPPRNKKAFKSSIITLITHFIMWLYLSCGLSRDNCRKARDMLVNILQHCLFQTFLHEISQINVPCNVQAISKQMGLNFPFEQHVCCPQCSSLYDIEVAPDDCIYKPTVTGPLCGIELFRPHKIQPLGDIHFTSYNSTSQNQHRRTGHIRLQGQPCLCITQASIENGINHWKRELSIHQGDIISDVSQGKVWRNLFPFQSSSNKSLELGFSLFVDWFNPRGNNISGKQASMGILALHCLNLQPRERFQQQHTCLAGVIPSPNQPDIITINNVLKPLIDELIELNHGVNINTPNYPHG